MKKVNVYKLSDGRFTEDEEQAIKWQREIDFKKAVADFADKYGVYEGKSQIENAILDNVEELKSILKMK